MQKNSSIDNYEIIKEIGKGSFSNVYLVKRKDNSKEFALKKVNLSNMSSKERENALKEVNFLAEIKDSNVIGYEESFYDNDMSILYLVMEYAPFGDLNKLLANNKNLKIYFSETELLNLYLQITSGLKAIHGKQIIHRDLKSANIFITQKNDLILKIGDFNVSKKIDYMNLKNTQTGTPYYASPEIWENKPYDFKSDIWSLGCLFYEIASFSTPFKGLNMKELFECIEKGIFAPLPKQYSNSITKLIKMCLRHDANLRPNIIEVKYFIENLKMEQQFKKMFDENYFDTNNINNNNAYNNNYYSINNTNFHSNNMKRAVSYIKNNVNLNLDNYKLPELDNSNRKNNANIILNTNNNNHLKSINIINDKKKRNLTPIKINYHFLIKEKTPIKLNEKLSLNIINNGIGINKLKNQYYKTDNNKMPIINSDKNSQENLLKEACNIKLKQPVYNKIQAIKNEEKSKIKEERDKENKDKNEENDQTHFIQKFNTIKNPLKQTDSKISVNNSQSIPEVINNCDPQSSISNDKFHKKINYFETNDDINNNINGNNENNYNKYINLNLNDGSHIKEDKNNFDNNINIKKNNNKLTHKLLQIKPKGLFFQKKLLKNFSALNMHNMHKRPVSTLIKNSLLNNNSDNISKIFDSNNNNNNNVANNNNSNYKKSSKIKLKPITPYIRSITPFNDNHKKHEAKIKNNNTPNLPNKISNNNNLIELNYHHNNSNDINSNNITNNYNNDKIYFIREKKNLRQLNLNKNKLNNLSQIKTKFLNYIKPNYKNFQKIHHKTEI